MGLVLGRNIGQAITVNGPAVIRVVRISGRRVRLYIDAPRETKVDREEIAERKREVKQ